MLSTFENHHGEVWLAHATKEKLTVTGSDLGWEPRHVENPDYRKIASLLSPSGSAPLNLVLSREEAMWLESVCVSALVRFG